MVSLRHFEQVRAIVAAGGLSAAARQLGLSQSALSRSISALERELDMVLFDRSAGGAIATAGGLFLADRAADVLNAVDSTMLEIREWGQGGIGKLRIAVGPTTSVRPFGQLLPWIIETMPQLGLEVRYLTGTDLAEGVARGRFDMAFSYYFNVPDNSNLTRIKLYDCPILFCVRPDHPLAGRAQCSRRDMLQYPIASSAPISLRRWFGRMSEMESRNATAFVFDHVPSVILKTLHSHAIGQCPDFFAKEELRRGTLVALDLEDEPQFECWLLTLPSIAKNPIIRVIAEKAREICQ
jgi:DNA-binding transcriptional LysR family regulator